ncbi:MAG: hypothetical protein Fues2KO_25560 [Fuerstiella sp.]
MDQFLKQLSDIKTNWSQIQIAGDQNTQNAATARRSQLHRYAAPVYQYLLGCVKDEHVADDLAQEFAVRFLDGRYQTVDRDRGRFRDFLKRCLSNLATDHFRRISREQRRLQKLADADAAKTSDSPQFDTLWQQEMLAQTWDAFEQQEGAESALYVVLRHRAENPDHSAAAIAAAVSRLHPSGTANEDWVRQNLHRARKSFSRVLRAEVAATLTDPSATDIDEELRVLGLLKYCES